MKSENSFIIGIGAGIALGVALHNIAMGIALGVAIGLVFSKGSTACEKSLFNFKKRKSQ